MSVRTQQTLRCDATATRCSSRVGTKWSARETNSCLFEWLADFTVCCWCVFSCVCASWSRRQTLPCLLTTTSSWASGCSGPAWRPPSGLLQWVLIHHLHHKPMRKISYRMYNKWSKAHMVKYTSHYSHNIQYTSCGSFYILWTPCCFSGFKGSQGVSLGLHGAESSSSCLLCISDVLGELLSESTSLNMDHKCINPFEKTT